MPAPANPVAWWVTEHKILSSNKYDVELLVWEDQNLKPGTLLVRDDEFYVQAWVDDPIDAVCKSTLVQEWANTTSRKILAREILPWDTYVLNFTGDIEEADIGLYFKINAAQLWNTATKTATAWPTLPVQLISVLAKRYWIVRFVNQTV